MADALKTDYKDDVLDTSKNLQRKYQMIQNGDGTVSFVDVTEYSQVGDSFGAADINAINQNLTNLIDNMSIDYGDINMSNSALKGGGQYYKYGRLVIVNFAYYYSSTLPVADHAAGIVPYKTLGSVAAAANCTGSPNPTTVKIVNGASGACLIIIPRVDAVPANTFIEGQICYITNE